MPNEGDSRAESFLLGREDELRAIDGLLDSVREQGSVLLIRGEPGVGKSAILAVAKSHARDRGMSVLCATGVQSETNLPLAGLHELLRPVLDRAERLPGPQRNALRAAFGMAHDNAADLFLIALAALDLLGEYASDRPLLAAVDDGHWLDQSSMDVLTFIARRLESEQIVLLIGSREAPQSSLAASIPELRLGRLDEATAIALLKSRNPELPVAIRDRVLHESAGIPLALVELPKAITSELAGSGILPAHLPLTARLERAFANRISELPLSSRQLLLIAALNEGTSLTEILSATRLLNDAEVPLDALKPAIAAGLLSADDTDVHFKHPLMRSAVNGAANTAERVAAHAALAEVLTGDPDRHVWHRAAATVEFDDAVAKDLESAAARAQQRGDVRVAIRVLERAAQLSTDLAQRARCLLLAAQMASEIGSAGIVMRLLQRAEPLQLTVHDRLRLMWLREATSRSISGSQALIKIADSIKTEDDVDLALDLLSGPATRGWWSEPDEEVCQHVIAAVESVRTSSESDPRFLLLVAMTSPIERGAFVIERLRRLANFSGDTRVAQMLGLAATQVGDFDLTASFLSTAAAGLRSEGRLALLAHALVLRAWSAIYLGNRTVAIADAEEGERLALETDQPIYAAIAQAAAAILASWRGDHERAEELATKAERMTQPFGILMAEVQMARGMNALGRGMYDDAYRHLHRMFDPADRAHHPMRHCFFIGDLAEAAVQSGRRDSAKAILAEMQALLQRTPSPQFHAAVHYARAVLADGPEAEGSFETALAADVIVSPFAKARLQLAFGTWLRRARRPKEARSLLQTALEAFDALGAAPWSERARQELRAAGATTQRRAPDRREHLTPQELQIALMAAKGLSNQEIGRKLYLSHRTVGSHLYRIFPKLGITSRHQLRDVLAGAEPLLT